MRNAELNSSFIIQHSSFPRRYLSVALSVGLLRLEVIKHRARGYSPRSSDFPHPDKSGRDRRIGRDGIIIPHGGNGPLRSNVFISKQTACRPDFCPSQVAPFSSTHFKHSKNSLDLLAVSSFDANQ